MADRVPSILQTICHLEEVPIGRTGKLTFDPCVASTCSECLQFNSVFRRSQERLDVSLSALYTQIAVYGGPLAEALRAQHSESTGGIRSLRLLDQVQRCWDQGVRPRLQTSQEHAEDVKTAWIDLKTHWNTHKRKKHAHWNMQNREQQERRRHYQTRCLLVGCLGGSFAYAYFSESIMTGMRLVAVTLQQQAPIPRVAVQTESPLRVGPTLSAVVIPVLLCAAVVLLWRWLKKLRSTRRIEAEPAYTESTPMQRYLETTAADALKIERLLCSLDRISRAVCGETPCLVEGAGDIELLRPELVLKWELFTKGCQDLVVSHLVEATRLCCSVENAVPTVHEEPAFPLTASVRPLALPASSAE